MSSSLPSCTRVCTTRLRASENRLCEGGGQLH
jgi:hypothetical protein